MNAAVAVSTEAVKYLCGGACNNAVHHLSFFFCCTPCCFSPHCTTCLFSFLLLRAVLFSPLPALQNTPACGTDNMIKPTDPIRCRTCGYRILYKVRTTRMVQFDAR